jgi:hypothetical protein
MFCTVIMQGMSGDDDVSGAFQCWVCFVMERLQEHALSSEVGQ